MDPRNIPGIYENIVHHKCDISNYWGKDGLFSKWYQPADSPFVTKIN